MATGGRWWRVFPLETREPVATVTIVEGAGVEGCEDVPTHASCVFQYE